MVKESGCLNKKQKPEKKQGSQARPVDIIALLSKREKRGLNLIYWQIIQSTNNHS